MVLYGKIPYKIHVGQNVRQRFSRRFGPFEDGRFAVLVLVVARVLCVPCHELLDMGVAGTHGTAVLEVLLLNFFGARHLVAVNHI